MFERLKDINKGMGGRKIDCLIASQLQILFINIYIYIVFSKKKKMNKISLPCFDIFIKKFLNKFLIYASLFVPVILLRFVFLLVFTCGTCKFAASICKESLLFFERERRDKVKKYF